MIPELHHQVFPAALLADVVERADVRMGQRGDGPRLALQAEPQLRVLGELRGQRLQRDRTPEARIAGAKHLTHTSRADARENFVRPDPRTGLQCHVVRQ